MSASYTPWPCVILAIDPGKDSGISLWLRGKLVAYGLDGEGPDMVAFAYATAEETGLPLVVAIEDWPGWQRGSRGRAGLNESVGVWKHRVAQLPRRRPTTKIVRISLQEWRRAIYGYAVRPKGYDWKALAVRTVSTYHIKFGGSIDVQDHNVAEAILIGEYATRAWKVGQVLPKRMAA